MRNSVFRTKKALVIEVLHVIVWLIIVFVVVPHMCRGLAYSIFYEQAPDRLEKLLNENKRRSYIAHNRLATRNYKFLFNRVNKTDIEMCIVVLTTARPENPRYLTQTVASIAGQLKKFKRKYSFAVYNVGGKQHREAFEVGKFVPVIHDKSLTDSNTFESQKLGYTSAMKWCLHKNARYNVILEDDVIVDRRFMSNLQFILNHCLADKEGKKWGFLKLYYPEKYQGWGNSPSNIVELITFTLLFGFSFTFLGALVFFGPMAIDLSTRKVYIKRSVMYFRLVFTHLCVLFVLLSIGRPHWEELRKMNPLLISVVEAKGCCLPAVLYPRTHLKDLIHFLDSRTTSVSFPHDLLIDQFVIEKGLNKLLAVPNLVNHIGMISSLRFKGKKRVSEFDLLFPPHF